MLHKNVLLTGEGVVVAVCRYAPGERHRVHTDRHSRIGFLVSGEFREEGKPGAIRMQPGQVLLKSRRAAHEDEFGPEGATIAAIEFVDDDPFDQLSCPGLWRQRADGFAMRHAATFLQSAIAGDWMASKTAGFDLVAASLAERGVSVAPAWMRRLKQELDEFSLASVDVTARAIEAGVHPAHASRLFRRCFGVSITDYAQAQSVRRAIEMLAAGAPLSDAAAAGFYDQSHMTRVFRRVTGRTPGAFRAILKSITS